MRKRRREVSIFNMSTIDLFACALGAFVLLTLVLLPYYLNIDRSFLDVIEELNAKVAAQESEIEVLTTEIEQCGSALAGMTEQRDRATDQLRSAEGALASVQTQLGAVQTQLAAVDGACSDIEQISFILVLMSWQTADDIDLHVVDPDGRRFFYSDRRISGSVAAFEEDNTRGPGNEVWLHPGASGGQYKIYYNYYRRRTNEDVKVRGTVFHQKGKFDLPEVSLSVDNGDDFSQAPLAAILFVDSDGNVSLR